MNFIYKILKKRFYFCLIKRTIFTINIFLGGFYLDPLWSLWTKCKSISGSNKLILKTNWDRFKTFGHG